MEYEKLVIKGKVKQIVVAGKTKSITLFLKILTPLYLPYIYFFGPPRALFQQR
jgi:hypothetical protein